MSIQGIQQHAGAVGTGVTGGSAYMGWFVAHSPELQALSFVVAIVAGSLTVVWYVIKIGTWARRMVKG